MSWKKIVIQGLILLVLITAIFIVNRNDMRKEGAEGVLLDFPAASIEKIELRQKDMKFVFARKGSLWYLQEPLAAKADKVVLEGILDDFCPLKYDRLVEQNARDLKNYGLDKPEIALKLFAKDMIAPSHTILLGIKNNLDSSSYVKLADGSKVVLLAAYKRNNLEKNLFAFRDKKILEFDSAAVESVSYHYENSDFVFYKKGDHWFMDKPIFSLAQEAKVSGILSAASLLEAKAFVGAVAADSSREFNLEKPLLKVEFKSASGSKKIAIGKKGDQYFALVDGFAEICEIDKDFCEKFSLDSAAFREKKIASFYAFDVRELQFQSGFFGFAIKKNTANAWELLKPPLKIKLDEEKISQLLTALADCEAREFIDNPQGAPEFASAIKLQVENPQTPGQLKNIELNFAGAKEDTVIVRNPSLPYWFKADKEILEKLPKNIADISEVTQKKNAGEK